MTFAKSALPLDALSMILSDRDCTAGGTENKLRVSRCLTVQLFGVNHDEKRRRGRTPLPVHFKRST